MRYFRAVVEAGGVTRAAELLHMTAGALSKALKRFEEELGSTLFRREGRLLVPNELGRTLYTHSHALLEEHARLLRSLEGAEQQQDNTLRIATFEVFSTYTLGALLQDGFEAHQVQVLDVGVGHIEQALRSREVDIGLSYVPLPDAELAFRKLARISFGIYGRAPVFRQWAPEDYPFAIPVTRLQLASGELLGIDCWPHERVQRQVKYRVTMLETALELARRGRCVVFIPDFIAALHNRTVLRKLQLSRLSAPPGLPRVTRTVHLIARRDDEQRPFVERVAGALTRVLKGAATASTHKR